MKMSLSQSVSHSLGFSGDYNMTEGMMVIDGQEQRGA
jgi:hypothetical protein